MTTACPKCHSPLYEDQRGSSTALAPVATVRECLECHATWTIPVKVSVSVACVLSGIGMMGLGGFGLVFLMMSGAWISVKAIAGCCMLICFGAATAYKSLFPTAEEKTADSKQGCIDCGATVKSDFRKRCDVCALEALPATVS